MQLINRIRHADARAGHTIAIKRFKGGVQMDNLPEDAAQSGGSGRDALLRLLEGLIEREFRQSGSGGQSPGTAADRPPSVSGK